MRKCIHYWTPNTSIEFLYFPWKKKSNHKEVTILALLFSPKPKEYLYSHKRKSNWVASEAHLPTPHHTQLLSWPSVLSKKHEKETTEMNSHEILRRKLTLILMNANDPHLNLRAGVVLSSVRFITQSCPTLCDPWTAAHQASLSITNSRSLPRLKSIDLVMPSNLLSSVVSFFSHLQSFSASRSFPMSQPFASGGQSFEVSALTSVLPMNTQDWSPLAWTGWISLQSKGLPRVFSNTTVQKHQFFGAQLSL